MSEPVDDKGLEEYLRRKSALSMGYKRIYVEETPPPELDRAITARARRALRWLIPALAAVAIACTIVLGIEVGVHKWMGAMVEAEKNVKKIRAEQQAEAERKRLEQPVAVVIDAGNIAKQQALDAEEAARVEAAQRTAWLEKINALKQAGKTAEAEAELKKFKVTYPNAPEN